MERRWLKEKRIERRLTQKEVAKLSGMSIQMYSKIELGDRRPSPELAQKLGKVLNFHWTKFYV